MNPNQPTNQQLEITAILEGKQISSHSFENEINYKLFIY